MVLNRQFRFAHILYGRLPPRGLVPAIGLQESGENTSNIQALLLTGL